MSKKTETPINVVTLTVKPKAIADNQDAFLMEADKIAENSGKALLTYLEGLISIGLTLLTGLSDKLDCLSASYDTRHEAFFSGLENDRKWSKSSISEFRTRIKQLTIAWHVCPSVIASLANCRQDSVKSNFFYACSVIAGPISKKTRWDSLQKCWRDLLKIRFDQPVSDYKKMVDGIMGKQTKTRVSKKGKTLVESGDTPSNVTVKVAGMADPAQQKPVDPDRDSTPMETSKAAAPIDETALCVELAKTIRQLTNPDRLRDLRRVISARLLELEPGKPVIS